MMRRLLLLFLALGLWQVAYTEIHCAIEPPDCQEGTCELCHLAEISTVTPGSGPAFSPPPTLRAAAAPDEYVTVRPFTRQNRGRAPPR